MDELYKKLLILRIPGIGPARFADIIGKFKNLDDAVASLQMTQMHRDNVQREMDQAHSLGVTYISDGDPRYPNALREIKSHPPILTIRGNISALAKPSVGIVGTRHATGAGMRFISDLAESFAGHGHVVVSGMAMGCDTAAHMGALRARGDTQTIAVLAGGVDYIWPLENESLYYKILERGAVLSEMPVGFVPVASNFVQRNRWIAGLSDKLILGEADMKSGSVHTARFANDYKRPVFAIPSHPSDARSMGPNMMIRDGLATICCGQSDFFDDENAVVKTKKQKKFDTENTLLDRLGTIPLSESVLAELVQKSIMEIKRDLVVLELQGLIAKRDGGYVRL